MYISTFIKTYKSYRVVVKLFIKIVGKLFVNMVGNLYIPKNYRFVLWVNYCQFTYVHLNMQVNYSTHVGKLITVNLATPTYVHMLVS